MLGRGSTAGPTQRRQHPIPTHTSKGAVGSAFLPWPHKSWDGGWPSGRRQRGDTRERGLEVRRNASWRADAERSRCRCRWGLSPSPIRLQVQASWRGAQNIPQAFFGENLAGRVWRRGCLPSCSCSIQVEEGWLSYIRCQQRGGVAVPGPGGNRNIHDRRTSGLDLKKKNWYAH